MLRKPILFGVKYSPFSAPGGNPDVGGLCVIRKEVAVIVGVNNSAPIAVTVGVNVSGVLVEVAKRFGVGMGVLLENGVAVSTGGGRVAVARNCGTLILGKPEQPARNVPSTRI
jgi:hypothetical protein